MRDSDCVAFLQWALPSMRMQWPGFRRVRKQVCKRIQRRLAELSCLDLQHYRQYLHAHPQEWSVLDTLCRVTVTRFYRDRQVFAVLAQEVLPELAGAALQHDAAVLRIWCAGCGSGEEPYSLSIVWHLLLAARFPALTIDILATDADAALLSRATRACYTWSAVRNLPSQWQAAAFEVRDEQFCLKTGYRQGVHFMQHDVRNPPPREGLDLICCRNLAFTYFEPALQQSVAETLHHCLRPGGVLVLGVREKLPAAAPDFQVLSQRLALYRKADSAG